MKRLWLIASVLVISGCSALQTKPAEDQVSERAALRHQLMLKQDMDGAYKFMSAGYRSMNSLEDYKRSYAAVHAWRDLKIRLVECVDDVCKLKTELVYDQGRLLSRFQAKSESLMTGVLNEIWIKEGGR